RRRDRSAPEDDEAVGRRGGPSNEDGPDPRPRREGGRPPASARGRGTTCRLELATARAARTLTTGPADTILPHEGDVRAVGPRRDGPARAHEEPRPRAHDEPTPQ